ncbi:beta-glucosidase [Mucilaginibacter gossypiicola]|uniref:Beta-glucosidase n=1 Tax=Mucilaginibacter gossypiicola TaxID=551995 RepID=A0A1H8BG50_9SPHI|nr:glycoside hydrolase family 3 C-terminal domain-containing protein [Mucilaginibacter gossypiicola]SEM81114.1 beta-glucosidase [Mucilaginibacter gossypiicola]
MKRSMIARFAAIALVLSGQGVFAQGTAPQFGKDPIKAIVKAMSLDDKVKIVVGKGFSLPGMSMGSNDETPDKIFAISGHTIPLAKFGIPSISMADGPSGIHRWAMTAKDSANNNFSTAWPVGTLLASSWDTTLIHKVGVAFGEEIKDYGIDFILGPGANIHRNPLGGRNFEYYSEDPLVSGSAAAAIINGIQSQGVGATLKHFAANNQETNRASVNEIISERALREIYLRNFEIAVKRSQPWAIMSSYNLVNGTYTSESNDLITKILRDDWGFKGMVMTDWFGGKDAVAQMQAGNNLLMPGSPAQIKAITEAVKSGKLSEAVLDKNVEGILNVWLKTLTAKGFDYPNKADLKAHAQVARMAAAESMVLLKNSAQALPAHSGATVALFGTHGYDLIAGGTGSGDVNKPYAISLADGLTNAGFKVDASLQKSYKDYLSDYAAKHPKKPLIQEIMNPSPFAPEYIVDGSVVTQKADASDLAIVYIGRNAGEGNDRKVEGDYRLTSQEADMINQVSDAFHAKHKPVIAVLNIGGVIDVTTFRDKVDAILLAWEPGEEGGNAIADVLSGKVNPSGKLATTFPTVYSDVPSAKNFPGKEFPEKATMGMMGKSIPAEVIYQEGIYVGYRYYHTFKIKPAYEFGYGLSYTKFTYSNLKLSGLTFHDKLTASVTITNSGNTAGKEVAELYLTAPKGQLDKPSEELKGFAKTRLLKPGESQTLTFTLNAKDLASFNTGKSAWIADAGKYVVKIGASSEDIKLQKGFTLPGSLTVEKVHKALAPQASIDELKN